MRDCHRQAWRVLVSLVVSLCSCHVSGFATIRGVTSSPRLPTQRHPTPPSALYLTGGPLGFVQDLVSAFQPTLSLSSGMENAPALSEYDALGHDMFVFLVASVFVVPFCKKLKITPVLGFLAVGCLIGPFGLKLISNSEADIQLGDFGILFLLFNEGLSLSPERIKELGKFTGLGVFQLLLSIGCIFIGTFWGGPVILKYVQEIGIPLDFKLLRPIVDNPVQSFCIAAAGALSSSAFILPVLKQKGWEDRPEGIAGLSILLLQDLAVAPLLVILPLLAGSGPSTSVELGLLVTKATLGFGVLLVSGSFVLRYVFDIVAATRSTETFVAATLLVAVGMGQAADFLGLSASTGAFAAGVLLAGNRYRAQIQADIKPFEGILLGVFFLTSGGDLSPAVVITEWLTLLTGIIAFIAVKAGIIFASGPALGLTRGQAARVALTLAGGGEFALVLFKLAQDLNVLPIAIARLLGASVIISMALTPLLANLGDYAGNLVDRTNQEGNKSAMSVEEATNLFDKIDTDGSGFIDLDELRTALLKLNFSFASIAQVFAELDNNSDGFIDREEWRAGVQEGVLTAAWNTYVETEVNENRTAFPEDAIMILGYGELGKSILDLLTVSPKFRGSKRGIVCFDLNPARVTAGVLAGDPVVYGDGGRFELMKAAGVTKPRAVIVTFASNSRRLDTTMRLRACLPEGTPIYVYEGNSRIGQELLDAGATEVICETFETALRFGELVGAWSTPADVANMRNQHFRNFDLLEGGEGSEQAVFGLADDFLVDLTEELGISKREIVKQWELFSSIAPSGDSVAIQELRDCMMRSDNSGPTNAALLDSLLSMGDEDGKGELTFVEYLRAYRQTQLEAP